MADVEHRMALHHERLANASPTPVRCTSVDHRTPSTMSMSHLTTRAKQKQMKADRDGEVERENGRLAGRLAGIAVREIDQMARPPTHRTSLGSEHAMHGTALSFDSYPFIDCRLRRPPNPVRNGLARHRQDRADRIYQENLKILSRLETTPATEMLSTRHLRKTAQRQEQRMRMVRSPTVSSLGSHLFATARPNGRFHVLARMAATSPAKLGESGVPNFLPYAGLSHGASLRPSRPFDSDPDPWPRGAWDGPAPSRSRSAGDGPAQPGDWREYLPEPDTHTGDDANAGWEALGPAWAEAAQDPARRAALKREIKYRRNLEFMMSGRPPVGYAVETSFAGYRPPSTYVTGRPESPSLPPMGSPDATGRAGRPWRQARPPATAPARQGGSPWRPAPPEGSGGEPGAEGPLVVPTARLIRQRLGSAAMGQYGQSRVLLVGARRAGQAASTQSPNAAGEATAGASLQSRYERYARPRSRSPPGKRPAKAHPHGHGARQDEPGTAADLADAGQRPSDVQGAGESRAASTPLGKPQPKPRSRPAGSSGARVSPAKGSARAKGEVAVSEAAASPGPAPGLAPVPGVVSDTTDGGARVQAEPWVGVGGESGSAVEGAGQETSPAGAVGPEELTPASHNLADDGMGREREEAGSHYDEDFKAEAEEGPTGEAVEGPGVATEQAVAGSEGEGSFVEPTTGGSKPANLVKDPVSAGADIVPALDEGSTGGEAPVSDEAPVLADEAQVSAEVPVSDEAPVSAEAQVLGEAPVSAQVSAEGQVSDEVPVSDETPVSAEAQVLGEAPVSAQVSAEPPSVLPEEVVSAEDAVQTQGGGVRESETGEGDVGLAGQAGEETGGDVAAPHESPDAVAQEDQAPLDEGIDEPAASGAGEVAAPELAGAEVVEAEKAEPAPGADSMAGAGPVGEQRALRAVASRVSLLLKQRSREALSGDAGGREEGAGRVEAVPEAPAEGDGEEEEDEDGGGLPQTVEDAQWLLGQAQGLRSAGDAPDALSVASMCVKATALLCAGGDDEAVEAHTEALELMQGWLREAAVDEGVERIVTLCDRAGVTVDSLHGHEAALVGKVVSLPPGVHRLTTLTSCAVVGAPGPDPVVLEVQGETAVTQVAFVNCAFRAPPGTRLEVAFCTVLAPDGDRPAVLAEGGASLAIEESFFEALPRDSASPALARPAPALLFDSPSGSLSLSGVDFSGFSGGAVHVAACAAAEADGVHVARCRVPDQSVGLVHCGGVFERGVGHAHGVAGGDPDDLGPPGEAEEWARPVRVAATARDVVVAACTGAAFMAGPGGALSLQRCKVKAATVGIVAAGGGKVDATNAAITRCAGAGVQASHHGAVVLRSTTISECPVPVARISMGTVDSRGAVISKAEGEGEESGEDGAEGGRDGAAGGDDSPSEVQGELRAAVVEEEEEMGAGMGEGGAERDSGEGQAVGDEQRTEGDQEAP